MHKKNASLRMHFLFKILIFSFLWVLNNYFVHVSVVPGLKFN